LYACRVFSLCCHTLIYIDALTLQRYENPCKVPNFTGIFR
jgi:hypothetical protein